MKHIGENKSFTTQVVWRGAAHWIDFSKNLQNLYIFSMIQQRVGIRQSEMSHVAVH